MTGLKGPVVVGGDDAGGGCAGTGSTTTCGRRDQDAPPGSSSFSSSSPSSPLSSFRRRLRRLEALEKWRELAIRPAIDDDCLRPDDRDLLLSLSSNKGFDEDLDAVARQCDRARKDLNDNLPLPHLAAAGPFDGALVARESDIPEAGLGLFYDPPAAVVIPAGTVVCYYTGHIHDFRSARAVDDKRYLMLVGEGGVHVDPGPLPCVKARYVNDPLNVAKINCRYVPEPSEFRSAVVAARDIHPGEEIYAPYGEAYWNTMKREHGVDGRILLG